MEHAGEQSRLGSQQANVEGAGSVGRGDASGVDEATRIVVRQKSFLWILWALIGAFNAAAVAVDAVADGTGRPASVLNATVFLLGAFYFSRQRTTLTVDGVTHRSLWTRHFDWSDFTEIWVLGDKGMWVGSSLRRSRPRPRIPIEHRSLKVVGGDSGKFAAAMGERHQVPVRRDVKGAKTQRNLIAILAVVCGLALGAFLITVL